MRLLLLAAVALVASGCGTIADDLYRQAERYGLPSYGAYGTGDYRRGVADYVREVDRAVGLDRRQAERITDRLEDRAARYARDRDRRYAESPFPRRARPSSDVKKFWKDADRDVERELDRRQRDRYRDFVRRYESGGRYRDRDWDDDDDDWDDDDWDDRR